MTDKCEFKSAKDLGLKQKEWEALITTLTLMEAGALIHIDNLEDLTVKSSKPVFNMSEWYLRGSCGTVACIGGSAEIFGKLRRGTLNRTAMRLAHDNKNPRWNLFDLFYNWKGDPTPKQAAKVLRGYLTTGTTDWSRGMEK